jgi:signal transduction histidine kinase
LKVVEVDSAEAYPSPSSLLSRLGLRTAHDLNNLIAIVSGHVYLLRQGGGADRESLDAIQSAVGQLERLSRSLSLVGGADGPRAAADVNAVARSVAGEAGAPAVELDLAEGLPAVPGSADALRSALRALVANAAAAAGPPRQSVRIVTRRDGDAVLLSVEDRGSGIDPEAAPRVFEPFFSTRGGRGVGIGLFVAAAVASAHGTSCRIEPREGGGTVVSMRLVAGA